MQSLVTTPSLADDASAARATDVGFAAEVAAALIHEARQPLSAMLLDAEVGMRWLLRADPNIRESLAALLRVQRDARRLVDVLERTRSVYLDAPSGFAPFALEAPIGEALDCVARRLAALDIRVSLRIADDLAPVWGDRGQIQQVVLNLLVNAADAIEATQGGARVIEIAAAPGGDGHAQVTIADTGCGFDPDAEARLFQRSFTTKPQGAGLGLAICATIVKAHGGAMSAERRAPRGAAFGFRLPFAKPKVPKA